MVYLSFTIFEDYFKYHILFFPSNIPSWQTLEINVVTEATQTGSFFQRKLASVFIPQSRGLTFKTLLYFRYLIFYFRKITEIRKK